MAASPWARYDWSGGNTRSSSGTVDGVAVAGLVVDWGDVPAWGALIVAVASAFGGAIVRWQRWRANRAITWETTATDDKMMVLRNTSTRTATNVVVVDPDDGWHVKGLQASLASIHPECGVDVFWTDPGRKRRPNQIVVRCDEQPEPMAVRTPW